MESAVSLVELFVFFGKVVGGTCFRDGRFINEYRYVRCKGGYGCFVEF